MAPEPMSVKESCSWSIAETTKGSHRHIIKGYSLFEGIGVGEPMYSDVFTVGGYNWAIKFYLEGFNEVYKSHLSVFIELQNQDAEVAALFDLSLLDHTKVDYTKSVNAPRLFNSNDHRRCWGYKKFFELLKLKNSKYLKDDCLVLHCNIDVVTTSKEPPKQIFLSIPPSNLGQCFKGFLDSGKGYDIVFKIGEKAFKAHKPILAARSPVFQAQFYGQLGNPKTDEILVDGIPAPVFQALLDFIYTDSFPNLDEAKLSSCSSTEFAHLLLTAADLYGLDRLKLLCEDKLSKELTADTVATTLCHAEKHNCPHLKSACLKFVVLRRNLWAVMKSEGFRDLEKTSPALLSELLQIIALGDGNCY